VRKIEGYYAGVFRAWYALGHLLPRWRK
jgi:hypothetical protein